MIRIFAWWGMNSEMSSAVRPARSTAVIAVEASVRVAKR
jgi:hypothetical protein